MKSIINMFLKCIYDVISSKRIGLNTF